MTDPIPQNAIREQLEAMRRESQALQEQLLELLVQARARELKIIELAEKLK